MPAAAFARLSRDCSGAAVAGVRAGIRATVHATRNGIIGAQAELARTGNIGALLAEVARAVRVRRARVGGQAVTVVLVEAGNGEAVQLGEAAILMGFATTGAEPDVASARTHRAEDAKALVQAATIGVLHEVAAHDAQAGAHAHVVGETNVEAHACALIRCGIQIAKLTHGRAGLGRVDTHADRNVALAPLRTLRVVAASRKAAERRTRLIERSTRHVFTTVALELVERVVDVREIGASFAAQNALSRGAGTLGTQVGNAGAILVGRARRRAESIRRTTTKVGIVIRRLDANALEVFLDTIGIGTAGRTKEIAYNHRHPGRAGRRRAARRRRGSFAAVTTGTGRAIIGTAARCIRRNDGAEPHRRQKPPCILQLHRLPPRAQKEDPATQRRATRRTFITSPAYRDEALNTRAEREKFSRRVVLAEVARTLRQRRRRLRGAAHAG